MSPIQGVGCCFVFKQETPTSRLASQRALFKQPQQSSPFIRFLSSLSTTLAFPASNPIPRSENESWARCMVFHHKTSQLAVATRDDVVLILETSSEQSNAAAIPPLVAPHLQVDVECMSFHPALPCCLAVGGRHGICLWYISSFVAGIALSTQGAPGPRMQFLACPETQVVSLAFSPRGDILACGGPDSRNLFIFHVSSGERSAVSCGAMGNGIQCITWSPNGAYVAAASISMGAVVVWETKSWTSMIWRQFPSPCSSLSWSSDSRVLLIGVSQSSQLFWLQFTSSPPQIVGNVVGQIDLKPALELDGSCGAASVNNQMAQSVIGCLAWDCSAQRLAVLLKDKQTGVGQSVVLLQTSPSPATSFRMRPIGVVAPPIGVVAPPIRVATSPSRVVTPPITAPITESVPCSVCLHPNWSAGALLAVAWEKSPCLSVCPLFLDKLIG
eukprot:c7089_g1_i2.p1 GENE.c7089_g1_i2~~c7089_g1_i2.p1  ORF type:complete len:483 (-),score=77.02 c7089_g1_i2:650-1978(-)